VGKFDLYNIQLKSMEIGRREITYHLDNEFFKNIDGEEFQKGDIRVTVTVDKSPSQSELTFALEGHIIVLCDRCLDEMELPIKTQGHLIVKLGKEFMDDGNDVVIIPEEQGMINVSWFMYEFVSLAIPMKHVHPYGLCNKEMSRKLRSHITTSADDALDDPELTQFDEPIGEDFDDEAGAADEPSIDPRWAALKNLKKED
jgi:uncharacterized metal-binding protein YceD (DUF177 family)